MKGDKTMSYEQAINYLRSSGMSDEQIKTIVNAIRYDISYDIVEKIFDLLETKEITNVQH